MIKTEYGKLIFRCRVGSHLYGLNRPESDLDYMSVFVPKAEYLLGLKKIEEVDNSTKSSAADHRNTAEDIDDKNYALPKFLHLVLQNNPNIVEVLFATPDVILTLKPEMQELIDNRDKLLSQRVYYTFTGYAFSQKKKLTVKSERFTSLVEGVELLEKTFSKDELGDTKSAISEEQASFLNYSLKYYKGQKQNCESFHKGMPLKMIYDKLVDERDNYGWRVHTDTFEDLGYDCYSEDTEFLTDSGWKRYNEVAVNDKLATIDVTSKQLQYQNYTDRKIAAYSGKMFEFENMFTKARVTPNHRMLVSSAHRGIKGIGYKYLEELSDWQYITAQVLDEGNRSSFHILQGVENSQIDYPVSDTYLKLLGAFVSEGTIRFRKNGHKTASIGQTNHGKLAFFTMIDSIKEEFALREYKYYRKDKKLWSTHWHCPFELSEKLYEDCSHLSKNKKLPIWISKLSKRQAWLLLYSMILGDGSEYKHCYRYYTDSWHLANAVQTLSLLSEKNCNVKMFESRVGHYSIYVSKDEWRPMLMYFNTATLKNRVGRKREGLSGGHKVDYNGKVCCFTVPNSNLITRLDGKIALHGNCKFGYHLIRILAEGWELLLTSKLHYPISGEAREDIMAVREGKVELSQLLEMYEKYEKRCADAEKVSVLPKKPDYNWADKWLIKTLKKSILDEDRSAYHDIEDFYKEEL